MSANPPHTSIKASIVGLSVARRPSIHSSDSHVTSPVQDALISLEFHQATLTRAPPTSSGEPPRSRMPRTRTLPSASSPPAVPH